jgi:LmbE family N-acetylglucosaminyl deacetylase
MTTNRSCLVIAAHPDDIESWCAGAVARLVADGWRAAYVLCTSGDKGSLEDLTPAVVSALREREQREAARVIGVADVTFLRYPDGRLEDTPAFRGILVREIRRHRPDLLLTHDPVWPYPHYTCHRDHRIVGRAALDAVYPYARDRLHYPEHLRAGLQPHHVPEVWLFASNQPDHFVDIAATMEAKIAARLAHRSQTADEVALRRDWLERAALIGKPTGTLAESFKRLVFP